MRIGLQFIDQIRTLRIKSPDPTQDQKLTFDQRSANAGGGWIAAQFEKIVASIAASYHQEHNDDDSHSTIHATGEIFERDRTAAIGEAIPIPFNPTNFTAAGAMTWTVAIANAIQLYYTLVGAMMTVFFDIQSSTVGGTPNTNLIMRVPSGAFCRRTTESTFFYFDNAVAGVGLVSVPGQVNGSLGNEIQFFILSTGNWAASAAQTHVRGQITFEIQTE